MGGDHNTAPLWSAWFGRFEVRAADNGNVVCRDWLRPGARTLPRSQVQPLQGQPLGARGFVHAFVEQWESSYPETVRDRPTGPDDSLFWQFPCRTEAAASDAHRAELPAGAWQADGVVNCYVALPWATWIDKLRVDATQNGAKKQIDGLRVRLTGLRSVLQVMGAALRVHTVCQHVDWARMLGYWRSIGVTDLWLSHAPSPSPSNAGLQGLSVHPWHLYAVNVLDRSRRSGLRIGKDPAEKRLLASFIGAHASHYVSDARQRLLALTGKPGFYIAVKEQWHFEDVVYRQQIHHVPSTPEDPLSVETYNETMSESRFSLCPPGAGPNTLRLWESLAVGSVPVLVGPAPVLPEGGTLPPIDWERVVLRIDTARIADLPRILSDVPIDEVRRRQHLGMEAFRKVCAQRCF